MPGADFLQNLIAFLIVLTPVVFFHELGHYWAARRAGVVVEVFSVGFGRELFGFTDRHGTRWRLAAIPLGGFVRMRGDEGPASLATEQAAGQSGSFAGAGVFARMFIVAAGPLANFLLGILLIASVYMAVGKLITPPVVGEVVSGSPAAEAGIQPGDRIVEINGAAVDDFGDLRGRIFESPGRPVLLLVERQTRALEIEVTPASIFIEELDLYAGQLGVRSLPGEVVRLGPSGALLAASQDSVELTKVMLSGLGRMVTGRAQQAEIGGPVRIAEFSGDAARQGLASLVIFAALISINLGLINLLPVPVLDGGHLVFFVIEAVLGRPLPLHWQAVLMRGGMALLLSLMVVVTFLDISRLLPF